MDKRATPRYRRISEIPIGRVRTLADSGLGRPAASESGGGFGPAQDRLSGATNMESAFWKVGRLGESRRTDPNRYGRRCGKRPPSPRSVFGKVLGAAFGDLVIGGEEAAAKAGGRRWRGPQERGVDRDRCR